jgi:hypothetical protein
MGARLGLAGQPGSAGLGPSRPARGLAGRLSPSRPARDLLCVVSVPELLGSFPLLHVGPCRQFLSKFDVAPCLARFGTFLDRSSEFVIFSG